MKVEKAGICIYCPPLIEAVTVFGCEKCGAHMCLKCNPHGDLCPLCAAYGPPIPQLPLRNPDDPTHRPRPRPRYTSDTALILSNFFPDDPHLISEVATIPEIWVAHTAQVKKSLLDVKRRHALQQIKEMSPSI